MSNDINEEKQLKEALAKLQSQIEEQKHLVERLLELKQRKLKHKATNGNSQVANVRAMTNPVTNSNKVPIGKIRKPGNNSTNNANNVPHVNDILPRKLTSLPPSNEQNQYEEPDMHNPFIKNILMNRGYHRGLNRLFFSGYKFLIIHNDRCLCLLSTNHEITKKALRNAYDMPAFITYKGKNYIKQPNGNYHLETPAAMYVPAVYVANNSIINKILTPIFFHTNGDLNTAKGVRYTANMMKTRTTCHASFTLLVECVRDFIVYTNTIQTALPYALPCRQTQHINVSIKYVIIHTLQLNLILRAVNSFSSISVIMRIVYSHIRRKTHLHQFAVLLHVLDIVKMDYNVGSPTHFNVPI
jgi:hypothetical protein